MLKHDFANVDVVGAVMKFVGPSVLALPSACFSRTTCSLYDCRLRPSLTVSNFFMGALVQLSKLAAANTAKAAFNFRNEKYREHGISALLAQYTMFKH
jgi:hypothetical protein